MNRNQEPRTGTRQLRLRIANCELKETALACAKVQEAPLVGVIGEWPYIYINLNSPPELPRIYDKSCALQLV